MEPALRTLGVLDRNSHISRFNSEQQLHPCSHLHDLHCDCTQCEREQVLAARRARRSHPRKPDEDEARNGRWRRRAVDENARRGESKIGRAAQMRPGRITLPPPTTTMAERDPASQSEQADETDPNQAAPENNQERGGEGRETTPGWVGDFYSRNPAALANGWLAFHHHRFMSSPMDRDEPASVEIVASAVVRASRTQLLGLTPHLHTPRTRR
ncbi:hypothetical protein PaG_04408 [Moesziomyces aphidis]|uniref:Uncharacterized protein n=1 Tax=Moesziomyces aphidis TaxID=84754 RepID=W3VKV5_MOEAP|nr:hypothetical protein PaG_04408 [Moesziomyces aphidis]